MGWRSDHQLRSFATPRFFYSGKNRVASCQKARYDTDIMNTNTQAPSPDYTLVEQALSCILRGDNNAEIDLQHLADELHSNPFNLHKAFRRCTGLTPKQFQVFVKVQRAAFHLVRRAPLLETAYSIGLSSPGRLHDHFVRIEALSPGEWKNAGDGLTFYHGVGETPLGPAEVVWTTRGIHRLGFIQANDSVLADTRAKWPAARYEADMQEVQRLLTSIFTSSPASFSIAALGTPFQIAVWRALLEIPSGSTLSYGQLALRLGMPKAARAVGSAVGANPVAILIPCHRVIRESGIIGDYHWGTARKCCLLAHEAADGMETL